MATSTGSSMRLAFSTLACPDWSLEQTVEAARTYGYDGVELRLLDGEVLTTSLSDADRRRVKTTVDNVGLEIAAVDTSVKVAASDSGIDDELRAWCEIAAAWGSPIVRVFGGKSEDGADASTAAKRAGERLRRVADHASSLGVTVALETHDAFSSAAQVAAALRGVDSPAVGALWDTNHPHDEGETPEQVQRLLGDRIVHVHIKDTAPRSGTDEGRGQVLLGDGDVPVQGVIDVLGAHGYAGWLSVEWEKKWHPELPEPDIALPHHARALRAWLR